MYFIVEGKKKLMTINNSYYIWFFLIIIRYGINSWASLYWDFHLI